MGIARLLVSLHPVGESDASDTDGETIGGLAVDEALDQRLPLLDHGPQLVRGQVHAVERAQAVLALNIFADELELSEAPLGFLLVLQVGQGDFVDAALKAIRGDSCSLGTVDQSLSDILNLEG